MPVIRTILIVESDLFVAELLGDRFVKDNYGVVKVDSIEKAEKIIRSKPPALLILGAPKIGDDSSLEFLKRARTSYSKDTLPIIVLSHEEDEGLSKSYLDAGANVYLVEAYIKSAEIIKDVRNILGLERAKKAKGVLTAKDQKLNEDEKLPDSQKLVPGLSGTLAVDQKSHYEKTTKLEAKIEKALFSKEEPSIIELVDDLVEYSYLARASDIHLDPSDDKVTVRLRIDGVLHDKFSFPKRIQLPIITRIKVLSGMRTDEHQMAQDGRFKSRVGDVGSIDIRVSIAPTYYGENCVMRILAEQSAYLSLDLLGFTVGDQKKIKRAMNKSYGMILATGPTGSGKTTTLYTILKSLNTPEVSIITIEDPIEYSIKGIDQIQVNERTGLTFAHGLRFILRQDPNIIMVGEIRDNETASIAVNAAMTGHLLLSTLHANDAPTALPRLIDMKVEPFLIGSTVNVIIGQRLVRQLCSVCRLQQELTEAEIEHLMEFFKEERLRGKMFYKVVGCNQCGETGYLGRIGVHEVLEITDGIRELIMRRANASEIKDAAIKEGMTTMLEDGFQKALKGITTLEEVLRVFHE